MHELGRQRMAQSALALLPTQVRPAGSYVHISRLLGVPASCKVLQPLHSLLELLASSSSSLESAKKGMSSLRVLSSPSARAIVLSLLTLFSLSAMSSFFSSSLPKRDTSDLFLENAILVAKHRRTTFSYPSSLKRDCSHFVHTLLRLNPSSSTDCSSSPGCTWFRSRLSHSGSSY